MKAMGEMKAAKAAGPSEVSVEMIAASGEIGIGDGRAVSGCVGWKRNAG